MAMLRPLVFLALLVPLAAAARAQDVPAPVTAALRPEFPLIVRIDDKALDPLRDKDILHQGSVDRMILGTRAIGASSTRGAIDVEMIPERDDASFTITFRGQTQTRTTGYNGPALIYSRTITDFECARRVVFEPRVGLVAGPTQLNSRTNLLYDGFGSSGGRLGRRIVARVAERRANESHEAARAIAARDNDAEIRAAFDRRLDAKLAGINRQLNIARYVNALFGPASKPHLATRSCKDCILVGIGNEESPQRLVTFPPEREKPAPIELWIHTSLLGERMARVATILDRIENKVLPVAAQLEVLQVIVGPSQVAERAFDIGFREGWVVIGLQNDVPPPTVAALIMVVDFASRRTATMPSAPEARVATAGRANSPDGASGGR